jgi:DNA-binding NarL/FixJ family response regulator
MHFIPDQLPSDFPASIEQQAFVKECFRRKPRKGVNVRQRSVLIVDDNPLIRKAICEAFTRAGDFEVCGEATNGQDAIEKTRLLHPKLVIMDMSMPVVNGIDATRAVKKLLPDITVIMYSLYGSIPLEKEASKAGAAAIVSKTEAVGTLIGKARELLYRQAA